MKKLILAAVLSLACGQALAGTVCDGSNGNPNNCAKPDGQGSTPVFPWQLATPKTVTSGNVANGTVAATLPAVAGKTTYISGLHVANDGATAALAVNCTITGINGGTQTFTFLYNTLNIYSRADIYFNPPQPASGPNVTIVVSCPAGGTGAANASTNVEGFQY